MTAISLTDITNAKLDVDHIAALATSPAFTATDRLGNTKRTMAGALDEYPNAFANSESAAASAAAADVSEAAALAAKVAAESARDAALIQSGVYVDEPTGRAAVADGVAFKVQGSGDVAAYEYRRTNSTTSVLIATYPSSFYVKTTAARIADEARNKRYLNRFDKNDKSIVAGYIENTGAITLTGVTIAEGVTVVTPLISVIPGEVLYLSQYGSNAATVACYGLDFVATGAATMAATFTVPAGVYYIKFSLVWKAAAYISSYYAAYYDYGYTADDYAVEYTKDSEALTTYRASLLVTAGIANLSDTFTHNNALVDALGILKIDVANIHTYNKVVKNHIPVVPSTAIKLTQAGITLGYVAEYDIRHRFISKGVITSGAAYTVTANTYYVYVGYYQAGAATSSPTLVYVTTPTVNAKALDSVHADTATQLISTKLLKNVSLFSTTLVSGSPSDLTVTADADGYVLTPITSGGGYSIFNLSPTIQAGDKLQLAIDYEVLELNCTSVQITGQSYFVASGLHSRVVTAEQVGVRNTLTVKSLTANGTNFTCGFKAIPSGAKINAGLAYYAKVRVRNISLVTYTDDLQQIQSIERVLGSIPVGTKYFGGVDGLTYDKYATSANFLGYGLVRIDDVENSKNLAGRVIEINSTTTNKDTEVVALIPPALNAIAGFVYAKLEITLNALNADYFYLGLRMLGGDDFFTFTRADIGVKRVITVVRNSAALSALNHYLMIATSRVYTNGVANTGLDGGSPTVNLTINSYTAHASQNFLPAYYHGWFFSESHTEDLITDYVKQPVQTLVINAYGDSITEHNFAKFIGCEGYNFNVNIYGLRGPVSDVNGPDTGACNIYGVMTNTADIILVMFGTHDFGKNVVLGSIGTLDDNTYVGAYEKLLQGLINKYPSRQIVVCTPPPRNSTNTDAEFLTLKNTIGLSMADYANALSALCVWYGIPCVDMLTGSGVNFLTMTGHPNLYVAGTTTDNTKISSAGVVNTDTGYFTSDYINVSQGISYGTPIACYFAEYNGSTFIRQSALLSNLYLHPNTTRVRLSVSKSEVVLDGTTVGVGPSRFWFADLADALMQDRIHPGYKAQRLMGAAVAKALKPILDAKRNAVTYWYAIYNNAD